MSADIPHVAGVDHEFVDAGGLRTHVATAGEGPPVVLLHGWPQHWYEWRDVIPRLAPHARVICPDLRGFGWTEVPERGYEKDQLKRDVLALLDALGSSASRWPDTTGAATSASCWPWSSPTGSRASWP